MTERLGPRRWGIPLATTLVAHVLGVLIPMHIGAAERRATPPSRISVRWAPAAPPAPATPEAVPPPPQPAKPPSPTKPKVTKKAPPKPKKTRKRRPVKRVSPTPEPPTPKKVTSPTPANAVSDREADAVPEPAASPPPQSSINLRGYWEGFRRMVDAHKRYPRMARRLRLEGVVRIRVTVDRTGRIVGAPKIEQSSGHKVLDQEALRMFQAAGDGDFVVPLPAGWRAPTASVVLPVAFQLRS